MKRYFVCSYTGHPLNAQPNNGYTELQAISRIHREMAEIIRLFPKLSWDEAKEFFIIVDKNFIEVKTIKEGL